MDFKRQRTIKVTYDFAVNGGDVSTIDLGKYVPANCIVNGVTCYTHTTLTSGGSATIGLTGGSTVIVGAIAYTDLVSTTPWKTVLITSGTNSSPGSSIQFVAASTLKAVIGTAAITAGKVSFYVTVTTA